MPARIVFIGPHAALAEAIEELDVPAAPRVAVPDKGDQVVDTGGWNLPAPVGMCLEELRKLRTVIEMRGTQLPR
jgi:hypothetical protein